MTKNFISAGDGPVEVISKTWDAKGIKHGFTGRKHSNEIEEVKDIAERLCKKLNLNSFLIPTQEHGRIIYTESSLEEAKTVKRGAIPADAVLLSGEAYKKLKDTNTAIGVCTADCLPILARGENCVAAIHSGWRGLANGIISEVISRAEQDGYKLDNFIIGPAASKEKYQVGKEVLDAIGGTAIYRIAEDGTFYLSLKETAAKQIKVLQPNSNIEISDICTMSDKKFNSHRIQGKERGTNLAFQVI